MATFSAEELKTAQNSNLAIAQAEDYFFDNDGTVVNGFDSATTPELERPDALNRLIDAPVFSGFDSATKADFIGDIDKTLKFGIGIYKERNGGQMPSAGLLASVLQASADSVCGYSSMEQAQALAGYDSASNTMPEQASFVPDIPKAMILSMLAQASPIVAYIPNDTRSLQVPMILLQLMTDKRNGAMNAGEYLDGSSIGKPYIEGQYEFKANFVKDATYQVTPRTCYKNNDELSFTPDEESPILPFLSGQLEILVNGILVADTMGDRHLSEIAGIASFTGNRSKKVTINKKDYFLVSGEANVSEYNVSLTFNEKLPDDAVVTVTFVANQLAKKDGNYMLGFVGATLNPTYEYLSLWNHRFGIDVGVDVTNQYANELHLSYIGECLNSLLSLYFFEQNVRLLGRGKRLATNLDGHRFNIDIQRGASGQFAGAVNDTGSLIKEVVKQIDFAQMRINQQNSGAPNEYYLYLSNLMAVYFMQMPKDEFTPVAGMRFSKENEIRQIGTLKNGTHVYHVPTSKRVVNDAKTTAEMLLTSKSSNPMQSPCIGCISQAPRLETVKNDPREGKVTFHLVQGVRLTPFVKYSKQWAIIEVINLVNLESND